MRAQRVNRYTKKNGRRLPMLFKQARLLGNKPIADDQTGFIYHPAGFPLEIKRKWLNFRHDKADSNCSEIGIIFESEKYIKPGTHVEITIPLRNESEKFRGKVVLIRRNGEYFEIGLWLKHNEDANRARMAEQICHIETYMQGKKYQDGPYNINPDRVAEEWISKYAGSVPSFK